MSPGGLDQGAAGDVYIGLDLGTSGLKAVALDAAGAILARGSAAYPTHRPAAGACEQDPADWRRAVERVVAQLGDVIPARRWRAIGLSGMIPTLVTLGPDGQPNGPAITWQDCRADDLGDEFRERCGAAGLYQLTGQWVDGRYLLPMFGRIAEADPARAAATATIASAKDYLFAWLTGELATDPSTAAGYGCYELETGRWSVEVLATAGLAGREAGAGREAEPAAGPALPAVRPSATSRPLRAEAAARLGCPPIPVVLGAADSVLGALGLGVREPGQVAYIAGTSNVILGITGRLVLDPAHRFLVTPLAEPGRWGVEMDLLATGSAITWLTGLLGGDLTAAGLVELAARTDPAHAPVLLPYLSPGEQGALWDPAAARRRRRPRPQPRPGASGPRAGQRHHPGEPPLPGRARRDRRVRRAPSRWPAAAPPTRPSAPTWPTPPAGWSRCRATTTPTTLPGARPSSRRWPPTAVGRMARSLRPAWPPSPTTPAPSCGTSCGPPTSQSATGSIRIPASRSPPAYYLMTAEVPANVSINER